MNPGNNRKAPHAQAQNFGIGFGVSVLVHALPIALWLWASQREPSHSRQRPRQLVVDLFGMISDRQIQERIQGDDEDTLISAAPPAPRPERSRSPQEARPKAQAAPPQQLQKTPSPVVQSEQAPAPDAPEQQAVAAPQDSPSADGPTGAGSMGVGSLGPGRDTENQEGRTLGVEGASEAALLGKYTAALTKRISAHIIYPADARLAGLVGNPSVRFTVTLSGAILPGSLAIQKSSGHPSIDRAAIRAAIESAPFPPPPRQMTVGVTLSFMRD